MAEALIKYETIDEGQIRDIMEGREPRQPDDWEDRDAPTTGSRPREGARAMRRRADRRRSTDSSATPGTTGRRFFAFR